ncbi:hypothetical protein EHS13_13830 [Paenibacillus psychroresistens]|uniref:Bacteriophage SP-beta YorD domain-containing protein n=1 Tax=Paenibacillus psychroresistens TaxID=1778678 RepID=A0A6B8RKJ9_9BACL|nr:hypothetical protein [Paenibacillus psychroresistens]QGQ95878.1 hypothetical protein EHS13_13830 [Paenibacillus psychroresistens]
MVNQYYANADINGKIIGFYNDDVHTEEQIPETAIEITEEQWQDALSNPRKYRVISGVFTARTQAEIDQEIEDEEANAPPVPPTAEQEIASLKAENAALVTETVRLAARDAQIQDDQMFILEALIAAEII